MYRVHEKLNRKIRFLSFYFGGKEIQIIFDLAHTHLILTKLELMQNDEVCYTISQDWYTSQFCDWTKFITLYFTYEIFDLPDALQLI